MFFDSYYGEYSLEKRSLKILYGAKLMDEEEKFEISREEIILFENYYIVLYYICSNINVISYDNIFSNKYSFLFVFRFYFIKN